MKREVKEEAGLEFEPEAMICVKTQGMSWVRFTFTGMRLCMYVYRIMQIVRGGNFRGFRRLASNHEGFPANFFLSIIRCFELQYNRKSFPMNNKKIMQPRNFSTTNDLHYTVY